MGYDDYENNEESGILTDEISDTESDTDETEGHNEFKDDDKIINAEIKKYTQRYSRKEWVKIAEMYKMPKDTPEHIKASQIAHDTLDGFIVHLGYTTFKDFFVKYGEDLLQEGRRAMYDALYTYDPTKGAPTTWVGREVLHAMRDLVAANHNDTTPYYVKSNTLAQKVIESKIRRGKSYTLDDLEIETQISRTTLQRAIETDSLVRHSVSLNQTVGDGKVSWEEMLTNTIEGPEIAFLKKDQRETLDKILREVLTPEERNVLIVKYGLDDNGSEKSYAVIERKTGIDKKDVKGILFSAERKVKRAIRALSDMSKEKKDRREFQNRKISIVRDNVSLTNELDSFVFED